jgi:predicted DNA-binding protein with PD1-like motif
MDVCAFHPDDGVGNLTIYIQLRLLWGRIPDTDIVRIVSCLEGRVPVQMELCVRFDYERTVPWTGKLVEQVELLSLIGDVALEGDEPQVHAHLVVGRRDGTAHGGHLLSATVRPTCEIVVTENPQHLQKQIDPESGLALIRL